MQAGNNQSTKLIGYCYAILEAMMKQSKPDVDQAVESMIAAKSSMKEDDFWASLDKQAQKVNEIRLYKLILDQKVTSRPLVTLMNARKFILNSKQVTNHIDLQMDKIFLSIDEWSSVVTRLFSGNTQMGQSLVKFQVNLDHLCKSNTSLKPVKENINRITLTTLLECIYMSCCTLERSYDDAGKHVVEQILTEAPTTHQKTTNLGMLGSNSGRGLPGKSPENSKEKIRPKSPLHLASKYVARIETPQSKLNELSPEQTKLDYPVYQDLLKKKAELMAELKEVEAEHKAKSDASLENLAKLLALNKIQKTSDKSYLEISKQYVAFMRKKMSAAGKKLITNQDMVMFKQLTEVQFKLSSNKKHPDIAVKIGEEVGESFRRFIRNNFTELKKEEQMYLAKTTDVREKATRRASIFRAQAFRQNDEVDEIESDANDLESEVQTSHQSEAKTSQKKEEVTSEREDSIEDQIRDEIASEEESEEDIFEIMTEPDKVDHSQGKKIDKPKLKSDQIELIYSEDEIPTLQKQEYKLSNVNHPAGLLESEVREDIQDENKFFQSKEGEEMLGNQNNLGLDSFELEKKEDYGLIDSMQNDEENIWASAMDGNDLLRLPTSKDDDEEYDNKAKQRRGTEAIRVIAESQVEDGNFPKSMSMNMKRGGSASSVFTNNRESIVKRLPIPALDTGSNNNTDVEIKMTDEGTSEDLIKIMPTED